MNVDKVDWEKTSNFQIKLRKCDKESEVGKKQSFLGKTEFSYIEPNVLSSPVHIQTLKLYIYTRLMVFFLQPDVNLFISVLHLVWRTHMVTTVIE